MNQRQHYVAIQLTKPNFESTSTNILELKKHISTSVLRRLRLNSNGIWYLGQDCSD